MASSAAVERREQTPQPEYVVYEDDYISIVWDPERGAHRIKARLLGLWQPLRAAAKVARALSTENYSVRDVEYSEYDEAWYITLLTCSAEYQMRIYYNDNNDTIIEIQTYERRGC